MCLRTGSRILIGSLLFILLVSCSPATLQSGSSQIPAITPETGLGAISGQIPEVKQTWPDEPLVIYAVPFYADQEDSEEGFYVLDTSIHSMTDLSENGYFQINDIQPGRYVMVAGPRAEDSLLVVNPDQTPLIIQVNPDQVTILENLQLAK